jgi:hypothetical protein
MGHLIFSCWCRERGHFFSTHLRESAAPHDKGEDSYFAGWVKAGLEGSSADPTLRKTPDFLSIMATSTNSMRLSFKKAADVVPTGAA